MPGKDREEQIRARAHELWELEGRPDGAGERHWLQAASEVDTSKPAAKAAPKKAAAKPKAPKSAAKPSAAGANAKPAPGKKPAKKA